MLRTSSFKPVNRIIYYGLLMATVILPRRIVEELERRGVDPGSYIVDLLVRSLSLDPIVGVEAHLELALRYLEEGKRLADGDPVQASEKLYKAAEEVVKALAVYYNLDDILGRVAERGRWTVTELSKAVLRISDKLGEWFRHSWNSAWALHVWGFHEARFDSEVVRRYLPDIERMVLEARRVTSGIS
jgi:hypothetical protein